MGAQGDDCNFSHELLGVGGGMGPGPGQGSARRGSLRAEPCKFYMSGSCFRGSRCVFMHDILTCARHTTYSAHHTPRTVNMLYLVIRVRLHHLANNYGTYLI